MSINYTYEEINTWNWYFDKGIGDTFLKLLDDKNLYEKVDLLENSKEMVEKLSKMCNNIYIVTSTLVLSAFDSKVNFIKNNFPSLEKHTINIGDKSLLNYNNAILLDDGPHNVEKVVKSNENGYAILLDKPYNQHVISNNRITRIKNFDNIEKVIEKAILDNLERHIIKQGEIYLEDLPTSFRKCIDNNVMLQNTKEKKQKDKNKEDILR